MTHRCLGDTLGTYVICSHKAPVLSYLQTLTALHGGAGAVTASQDKGDVPELLTAKPQLNRAPTRGGSTGARGQGIDPRSIPAGCASDSLPDTSVCCQPHSQC